MIGRWRILHTEAAVGWSGQQIRVLDEARGMIERGHSVVLACQPDTAIAGRAADWGIETITTKMTGALDIAGIRYLRAFMQDFRPHVVNTHSSRDSWTGLIAARLAGDTVTVRTRHFRANITGSFQSRLLYCRLSDVISTSGEALRQYVMERTGLPPHKVVSIPTGIDLRKFSLEGADASVLRRDIGVPEDVPLIGTAAMFIAAKGLSYFVDAAARVAEKVPEARFVIVGDNAAPGSGQPRFVEQIAQLGMKDRIALAGFRADMPNVFAALDVFVLSSLSEGTPQVISQAMAMERPVVATNVGGVPEQVLDGETGYLVERANPDALADGILRMLADHDAARRMGENGRRHVERHFSIENMLDATEALYARIVPPD